MVQRVCRGEQSTSHLPHILTYRPTHIPVTSYHVNIVTILLQVQARLKDLIHYDKFLLLKQNLDALVEAELEDEFYADVVSYCVTIPKLELLFNYVIMS